MFGQLELNHFVPVWLLLGVIKKDWGFRIFFAITLFEAVFGGDTDHGNKIAYPKVRTIITIKFFLKNPD